MATCKDYLHNGDEYIKREDAIKAVTVAAVDMGLSDPTDPVNLAISVARRNIRHISAADVVPKSEYIQQIAERQAAEEAIREIFADIQACLIQRHWNGLDIVSFELDAVKYAELKKKYVPDTNAPAKVSSGDICVVCGEHVPEGRQICSMCETGQEFFKKRKE